MALSRSRSELGAPRATPSPLSLFLDRRSVWQAHEAISRDPNRQAGWCEFVELREIFDPVGRAEGGRSRGRPVDPSKQPDLPPDFQIRPFGAL